MTCERGFQRREVACMYQLQNGSLIHTKEPYCQGGKPPVLQGCEGRLCLTIWEASEWSKVGMEDERTRVCAVVGRGSCTGCLSPSADCSAHRRLGRKSE